MNFQQTSHVRALARLLREGALEILDECDRIDAIQFGSIETAYLVSRLNWFDEQLREMNTAWASMSQKIVQAAGDSQKRQTGGFHEA